VKRLIVLLVLVVGGLVAAALSVPTNAAVVNGTAISQQQLNSDVSAIAGSPDYQCYLNSQTYLSSNGSSQLPPVQGAGKGQNQGDNPTANSAFVATYLDTEIGHELVLQVAAQRGVTVTQAQLANAQTSLSNQISQVMNEVAQTQQGQNPAFSCGHTPPLTGEEVLGQLPVSFVDDQVHFVATATALQETLAGVGSSESDLAKYYTSHRSEFDTVCFNAAAYSSQSAAEAAAASVASGTPFAQVAANATQHGTIPCGVLVYVAEQELGVNPDSLVHLTTGKVSDPINVNGNYLLLEVSSRTPTPYGQARSLVGQVAQNAGSQVAQRTVTAAERHASVSVDPRYGTWVPISASVFTPFTPERTDVLNPAANEVGASSPSQTPFSG
jgi:hypothetical protein